MHFNSCNVKFCLQGFITFRLISHLNFLRFAEMLFLMQSGGGLVWLLKEMTVQLNNPTAKENQCNARQTPTVHPENWQSCASGKVLTRDTLWDTLSTLGIGLPVTVDEITDSVAVFRLEGMADLKRGRQMQDYYFLFWLLCDSYQFFLF